MDTRGIEQMIGELRSTAQTAANKPAQGAQAASGVDFAEVLQGALKDVSAAQQEARAWPRNSRP